MSAGELLPTAAFPINVLLDSVTEPDARNSAPPEATAPVPPGGAVQTLLLKLQFKTRADPFVT
jgi:hypothetical protein